MDKGVGKGRRMVVVEGNCQRDVRVGHSDKHSHLSLVQAIYRTPSLSCMSRNNARPSIVKSKAEVCTSTSPLLPYFGLV